MLHKSPKGFPCFSVHKGSIDAEKVKVSTILTWYWSCSEYKPRLHWPDRCTQFWVQPLLLLVGGILFLSKTYTNGRCLYIRERGNFPYLAVGSHCANLTALQGPLTLMSRFAGIWVGGWAEGGAKSKLCPKWLGSHLVCPSEWCLVPVVGLRCVSWRNWT